MRFVQARLFVSTLLIASALSSTPLFAACVASQQSSSLDDLVSRIRDENRRFVFVGERHGIGPVKRFAVELTNALMASGTEVGLYVEGFRQGCAPRDEACWSLAAAFNRDAFYSLLDESQAPVHAIDPRERDHRAARMAAAIAQGSEPVRVVLVGRSHVVYAGEPEAELWVYGGSLRFPDPGDLAESFPRESYLTVGLETADDVAGPYSLLHDGCATDYRVTTRETTDY